MAIFGNTSICSRNESTGGSEYTVMVKFQMPENGEISKITTYISSYDSTPQHAKAAIYADNGGVPDAKLGESVEITVSALAWYDFNFPTPVSNNAGARNLWLAIAVQTGWRTKIDDGGVNQYAYHSYLYTNAFPVPFVVERYANFTMSIFATYTGTTMLPPTANFTVSGNYLDVLFDASSSIAGSAPITSYAWNFGDGIMGSGITAPHTYASAGTYTVTLTVVDNNGLSSSTSKTVTVQAPTQVPPTAAFTASANYLDVLFNASASLAGSAPIASYAWDFGDGSTGSGINPSHTYSAAGTYNVVLTVTDTNGLQSSVTHSITVTETTPPPYGAIFGYPTIGGLNNWTGGGEYIVLCKFTMPENGNITKIAAYVSAADQAGNPATAPGKACIYSDNGGVPGNLLAESSETIVSTMAWYDFIFPTPYINSQGAIPLWIGLTVQTAFRMKVDNVTTDQLADHDWAYASDLPLTFPVPLLAQLVLSIYATYESYTPQPPVASFTTSTSALTVSFDASSSHSPSGVAIVDYAWNFGDGSVGTGKTVTHTYALEGTYDVVLTITDSNELTDSTTQSIFVSLPTPITGTTPWDSSIAGVTLDVGTYNITVPSSVVSGIDTWLFKLWEDGSTNPVRTFNLSQDLTLTATYELATINLVISVNDLTMGTTDPIPETYKVVRGSNIQISAIPLTGYMFDHWELDGGVVGTVSPYTLTNVQSDHTLLAVFVVIPPPPLGKHNLTISTTVGGTTTPETGTWEFNEGVSIQVSANPNNGYIFDHWELDGVVAKANPISILIDKDKTLLAVFIVNPVPMPIPIPLWQIGAAVVVSLGGITTGYVTGYVVSMKTRR